MLDYCIRFYTSTYTFRIGFLSSKLGSLIRFFLWGIVNLIVPLVYLLDNLWFNRKLSDTKRCTKIIVSLTSFPGRISRLWIVVESILRQSVPPDMIVLWLSRDQFSSLGEVPNSLLSLQNRGLKIVLCDDDLRSHKKYYYAFESFPNDIIITIDDDFLYSSHLIEDMMRSFSSFPNCILANRGLLMRKFNDKILPYNNWIFSFSPTLLQNNFFFTSGGGTLFPPRSLHCDVLNQEIFLDICKHADDVWLNAMARLNKTDILKVDSKYQLNIPLFFFNDIKLTSINVDESMNDVQIEKVREYCVGNFNFDPFYF